MKRSFLKSLIWMLAIVAVLFVSSVAYSQPIVKRYPPTCTNVSGLLTAVEEGFIPCSWYQNGSAPGTPTYVTNTLATPMYLQIKDRNSNLQLDISRLADIVAGLANTYRGAVTISTNFGYNGVQWLPNLATTGVPHMDLRRINGNAVNTNGGVMGLGTITFTLATNDPAVTDLAAIEVLQTAIVADTTTIAGDTTAIQTSIELRNAKLDDDAVAQCVAITDTDADYALPTAGDWYCVSAGGNTAFIRCGATPAVDHTIGNYSFFVSEGATKCRPLTGPNCAVIGVTTAGQVCFEHLNSAL